MSAMSTTRMRLERLADERARFEEKIEDALKVAEEEERDLAEFEEQQLTKYRARVEELEEEINVLASDLERANKSKDVSTLIRVNEPGPVISPDGPVIYRTFAQYARDALIKKYDLIASHAGGDKARAEASDNLERALVNTLTSNVAGLVPATHMAQIMDVISRSRPVVSSARSVNLDTGKLTYPQIAQRPSVLKQTAEKTLGGTANMQVTLTTVTADTYIGGGDLSWQTINWSTPDALQLWFDLAAEAYARQTETAACTEISTAGAGTISSTLGTAGTEDFAAWKAGVLRGVAALYAASGGRTQPDTLYVSPTRFFQLAGLSTANNIQISAVGGVDIGAMSGNFVGLNVIGSYGFTANETILGERNTLLAGETAGAPVELRAVEPSIGGMEVGVIGAFKAKVYDAARFIKLNA
jgi:HK97 family phage major capsid protein